MRQLLFGTNNQHKLTEIRQILEGTYEILSLADLGIQTDIEETADTLSGNAILKAEGYYQLSGIPCFADDTGLEVTALGGAPGVYTARYAGPKATYADNVRKLIQEMEGQEDRTARFATIIAYHDGKTTRLYEGFVYGHISSSPMGGEGFGYDPIFVPYGFDHSFAQMSSREKNQISHRGIAVREFISFLKTNP